MCSSDENSANNTSFLGKIMEYLVRIKNFVVEGIWTIKTCCVQALQGLKNCFVQMLSTLKSCVVQSLQWLKNFACELWDKVKEFLLCGLGNDGGNGSDFGGKQNEYGLLDEVRCVDVISQMFVDELKKLVFLLDGVIEA
ncbi:hypothetical protein FXO38_18940 [Capsicum annuum]|nr:hypothetical protein FXO38_18940 [Capsicum annuum]KAF3650083.1 hypothetical protein FXO37_18626 [Capsicum annuum]